MAVCNFAVRDFMRYLEKALRMKNLSNRTAEGMHDDHKPIPLKDMRDVERYIEILNRDRKKMLVQISGKYEDEKLSIQLSPNAMKITADTKEAAKKFNAELENSLKDLFLTCYSSPDGPDDDKSNMYYYKNDHLELCRRLMKTPGITVTETFLQDWDKIIPVEKGKALKEAKKLFAQNDLVVFRIIGKYQSSKVEITILLTVNKVRVSMTSRTHLDAVADLISD